MNNRRPRAVKLILAALAAGRSSILTAPTPPRHGVLRHPTVDAICRAGAVECRVLDLPRARRALGNGAVDTEEGLAFGRLEPSAAALEPRHSCRPCHPCAISSGHQRYAADSHGRFERAVMPGAMDRDLGGRARVKVRSPTRGGLPAGSASAMVDGLRRSVPTAGEPAPTARRAIRRRDGCGGRAGPVTARGNPQALADRQRRDAKRPR
jgi:hypothetical protein